MRIEIIDITPEMAAEWLEKWNIKNRLIVKNNLAELVRTIKAGRWQMTGEPITFSASRLIQGQHRLMAIVEAGVTCQSVVIWDAPDAAFDVLDQGARRSAGSILQTHGIQYSSCVAAMLPMLDGYYNERPNCKWVPTSRPTSDVMREMVTDAHIESAKIGTQCRVTAVLSPSLIAAWHYITVQIDPDLATKFWPLLCLPMTDNHNAGLLINRLMHHAALNKIISNEQKFWWASYAWNAERTGRALSVNGLKYHKGEPLPRFC